LRKEVPVLITLISAIVMLVSSFFTGSIGSISVNSLGSNLSSWGVIVAAFAVGLGAVNLAIMHVGNISKQKDGWPFSVVLMASMALFFGVGVYNFLSPENAATRTFYQDMFTYAFTPISNAVFALLAFYVASASYRAFRARNTESTLLLIAAILVMLGKAPVGELIWSKFPEMSSWLLDVPNTAGQRGLTIGVAVGAFSTALRTMLGIERGHLGLE
jgi:hypothetical protein